MSCEHSPHRHDNLKNETYFISQSVHFRKEFHVFSIQTAALSFPIVHSPLVELSLRLGLIENVYVKQWSRDEERDSYNSLKSANFLFQPPHSLLHAPRLILYVPRIKR